MAFSLLIVVAAAVGLFSWDRWLRYDDAAEFQGSWQAHGTTGVVVIDGERINLTDDVAYSYRIDPMAKTVSFSFGSLEGQGRYRFSLDRSQLVITEGAGYSWLSTLVDDIGWRRCDRARPLVVRCDRRAGRRGACAGGARCRCQRDVGRGRGR